MTRTFLGILSTFVLGFSGVFAQFVTERPTEKPLDAPVSELIDVDKPQAPESGFILPPPPMPPELIQGFENEEELQGWLDTQYLDEIDFCSFSDEELDTVKMVKGLMETYGESRIVQKLFGDEEMKDLVRIYIQEMILKADAIITMCEQGTWSQINTPRDFIEYENTIYQFAQILGSLKQREVKITGADPAADGFDVLRSLVLGDLEGYEDQEGWISKTGMFLMNLTVADMYSDFDINLEAMNSSIGTKDASLLDAEFSIKGAVDIQGDGDQIKTSGTTSAQMKIVDNNLYLMLKDFDIELGDITFDNQYDAAGFNEMLAGINVIQGKYIEIPLMPDLQDPFGSVNPFIGVTGAMQQQEMLMRIMTSDWLTTVATEGNTTIAGMNPVACASMEVMNEVSGCLLSWEGMSLITDNGGMFFMTNNGDTMSMGIVEEFAAAIDDDMLENLAGIPLLTRDSNRITELNIPFYQDGQSIGGIRYADNELSAQFEYEEYAFNYETSDFEPRMVAVDVKGKTDADTMNLIGTVVGEEVNARFSLDLDGDLESMVGKMTLDIEDSSEYGANIAMDITFGQDTVEIETGVVTKPEDREIIDIDSLMRL